MSGTKSGTNNSHSFHTRKKEVTISVGYISCSIIIFRLAFELDCYVGHCFYCYSTFDVIYIFFFISNDLLYFKRLPNSFILYLLLYK